MLGDELAGKFPWAEGVQPFSNDPTELIINNTWRATLAVTGAEGLPPLGSAGNVLLPELAVKSPCACRRPAMPRRQPPRCATALERDPPYGAQVSFEEAGGTGGLECARLRTVAGGVDHARPRTRSTGARPCTSAAAARSRSWGCWASVSRDAVLHHRRARTACQRPWPERVPAPRLREEAHRLRLAGARGPREDHRRASACRPCSSA